MPRDAATAKKGGAAAHQKAARYPIHLPEENDGRACFAWGDAVRGIICSWYLSSVRKAMPFPWMGWLHVTQVIFFNFGELHRGLEGCCQLRM